MNKSLKILFLVPRFPTVSETFILNQIIDLIDRGHSVNIFATEKTKKKIHSKIKDYALLDKTFYADTPTNIYLRLKLFVSILFSSDIRLTKKLLKTLNFFKYGASALKLSRFFKVSWLVNSKDNYDIIHAHFGPMSDYYFYAKECGFFKNAKLIVTFHGYDIIPRDNEKNKIRYKKLIEQNITLTANTPYTKSLIQKTGYKNESIHILPVGLDTNYYSKSNTVKKDKNKITILFCGRIIKFKGVSRIADIANILINKKNIRNITFKIIGESGESNSQELNLLKQKIDDHELKENFELLGAKTQKEVIHEMNTSDLLIMPGIVNEDGRAENQGLVIQEAQSMQLPVIVTNAGGMKYGLIDNITGYVIEKNDLNRFAEKIELLLNNPNLKEEMGLKGREFVTKNYDSKMLGDKLEKIYHKILKQL